MEFNSVYLWLLCNNNDIILFNNEIRRKRMKYCDAIKLLRKKLLLSQTEFADMIGVAFVTVNRWENGNNIPTFRYKRKLAALFREYGIEVEE